VGPRVSKRKAPSFLPAISLKFYRRYALREVVI
jgi:hypothetical protein